MPHAPEPARLPLALRAEPLPDAQWVQVEIDDEVVGAFMVPDPNSPAGCWIVGGSIGIEPDGEDDEWGVLGDDGPVDHEDADRTLVAHATLQLGDSGAR